MMSCGVWKALPRCESGKTKIGARSIGGAIHVLFKKRDADSERNRILESLMVNGLSKGK
jgi:hypothetical protein